MPAPELDDLADAYIALERRVHGIISQMSGRFCAQCTDPCCHSKHCSDVLDSPWLRALAARQGVELPEGDSESETVSFLGETGCQLKSGRPVQCTWYMCEGLGASFADPLERFLYQVASDALGHVVRRAARDRDLVDLELADLTSTRIEKLERRILEAHHLLNVSESLRQGDEMPERDRMNALCELAAALPYAARSAWSDMHRPADQLAGSRSRRSE